MNSILIYALLNVLISEGIISINGWQVVLLGTMQIIPPCTLVPRFILSLRKLYARDLRGRFSGSNIDTAFGLTTASGNGTAASTIVFADGLQNEELELGEEIQMEERGIQGSDDSGA